MEKQHQHPFFSLAVNMVQQAGLLARQVQEEVRPQSLAKHDRSPVAVADFAVQALVGCLLERAVPRATLVAEEDSRLLRQPEAADILRHVAHFLGKFLAYVTPESVFAWIDKGKGDPSDSFWVLYPIDGTTGFLRGEQYAIALAYIERKQVQFGVLGCPNLSPQGLPERSSSGAIIGAERGRGAWIAPMTDPESRKPLRVSSCESMSNARILRSVESSHTNEGKLDEFCRVAEITADPVCLDSQAKYAIVASGHAELLLRLPSLQQPDYREFIWDQAAGSIVVEEAGGKVSDIMGNPLDFSHGKRLETNTGILVSNKVLHAPALATLKKLYS